MGQSYTNGGVFSCFTTWGFFPHVQVPPFHSISHPHLGIPGMAAQLKTQRFVRVHLVVILRTATKPRNRVVTRFVFSVEPSKWHWINWIILNPRKTMYDHVVPGPMCIPWSWGSGRSLTWRFKDCKRAMSISCGNWYTETNRQRHVTSQQKVNRMRFYFSTENHHWII